MWRDWLWIRKQNYPDFRGERPTTYAIYNGLRFLGYSWTPHGAYIALCYIRESTMRFNAGVVKDGFTRPDDERGEEDNMTGFDIRDDARRDSDQYEREEWPDYTSCVDSVEIKGHILTTPETCSCDKASDILCNVCDGGLAVCERCGKAEAELDEPCVR